MKRQGQRESCQIWPKIFRHSEVIHFDTDFSDDGRMTGWHRMTGMKSRNATFSPEISDDGMSPSRLKLSIWRHSCHPNQMSFHVIPVLKWLWNEWNDARMTVFCHHEIWLAKWHSNEGVTIKWQNDIRMVGWHSNDGMTPAWCFKVEMS